MTPSESSKPLLDQQVLNYLSTMESATQRIDYSKLKTDQLLLIEALNDWSGRVLGEGGEIQLTHGCDDPCCASAHEVERICQMLHGNPIVLYPISGFSLSAKQYLKFDYSRSAFRLLPHNDGSQASGISIAEGRGVRDAHGAMQLWVLSAVEDCLAYMEVQLEQHGLLLEDEERRAVRSIMTSAIQKFFSPGHIYNAAWRTVKDAASHSTLHYSSSAKAAKRVPKRLDEILAQASKAIASFPHYERIARVPMGAVLTLFQDRFGISHRTSGAEVERHLLIDEPDRQLGLPDDVTPPNSLVCGTFHFVDTFTPLDRLVVTHFNALSLSSWEPEWDRDNGQFGRIGFTLGGLYDFDGSAFVEALLPMLGIDFPVAADIARHAEAAIADKANGQDDVDISGRSHALKEALIRADLSVEVISRIEGVYQFPVEPPEVLQLVRSLPLSAGLLAIRSDHAFIYGDYTEKSSTLAVCGFQISIPEAIICPDGDDRKLVAAVAENDEETYAELLGTGFSRLVYCGDPKERAQVLRAVAGKLSDAADRLLALTSPSEGAK